MKPNVLLLGATGTGKTFSLTTIPDETFIIFTEPGMESVEQKKCLQGLHYTYIPPATPKLDALMEVAKKVGMLDFGSIANMKDPARKEYDAFRRILGAIANFKCDRCGQSFGDATEWGEDRALCIDSLTGLNVAALQLVTGLKPVRAMQEWQVAQNLLENLLQTLCTQVRGLFVLTAHVEREMDEVTGGVQLMASTLGRKLAPKLPRFFSDVIMCVRRGTEFSWSTAERNADLKARNVPWSDKIPPDFGALLRTWEERRKEGAQ